MLVFHRAALAALTLLLAPTTLLAPAFAEDEHTTLAIPGITIASSRATSPMTKGCGRNRAST